MRFPNSDVYSRSGPHKKVEQILKAMGLAFESEYKFPPYTLDIYLSEWHLGIEIDGPNHSKKKDIQRDSNLYHKYGLLILRIPAEEITQENVEEKLLTFIDRNYEDIDYRKSRWKTLLSSV